MGTLVLGAVTAIACVAAQAPYGLVLTIIGGHLASAGMHAGAEHVKPVTEQLRRDIHHLGGAIHITATAAGLWYLATG